MIININQNISNIHYYGNSIVAFSCDGELYLFKSAIEVDIIEASIKGISLDNLAKRLFEKYNILDGTIEDINKLIYEFITSNANSNVFALNTKPKNEPQITGKLGQYYPSRLQIDLTSCCNLSCPHCYKMANDKKAYISIHHIEKLLSFLDSGLHEIGLTGGEPLLHPEFIDIATMCRKKCMQLELNTNGILLHKIPIEILHLFEFISISLYGLNDEEYYLNTGIRGGFTNLKKSCTHLSNAGIKFNISMILNSLNLSSIRDYVEQAIALGATSIQVGLTSKIGRANDLSNDWIALSLENQKSAYRTLRQLNVEYHNNIKILEWERDVYRNNSLERSFYHLYFDSPYYCTAGTLQWSIDENFRFKPCVLMPNERQLTISFNEWKDYVCSTRILHWGDYIRDICDYCAMNHQELSDYCERLVIR